MASKKKPKIKGLKRAKRIAERFSQEEEDRVNNDLQVIKKRMTEGGNTGKLVKNSRKVKASELILDFGDPLIQYLQEDPDPDLEVHRNGLRNAVGLSVLAWNLGTFPEGSPSAQEGLQLIEDTLGGDPTMDLIVKEMIANKRAAYNKPIHQFLVHEYQVSCTARGELHLTVAVQDLGGFA